MTHQIKMDENLTLDIEVSKQILELPPISLWQTVSTIPKLKFKDSKMFFPCFGRIHIFPKQTKISQNKFLLFQ